MRPIEFTWNIRHNDTILIAYLFWGICSIHAQLASNKEDLRALATFVYRYQFSHDVEIATIFTSKSFWQIDAVPYRMKREEKLFFLFYPFLWPKMGGRDNYDGGEKNCFYVSAVK